MQSEVRVLDISTYPVMPKRCATCPFRTDERGNYLDDELVTKIQQQCLAEASQICHHSRLSNQPETHLCRGARDFQLTIFHRLGLLTEPTDEEWNKARTKLGLHSLR